MKFKALTALLLFTLVLLPSPQAFSKSPTEEITALKKEVARLKSAIAKLTAERDKLKRAAKPKASEPSRERVKKWFRSNDSAPPASWYKNGDPWRNPTAEEMQEILEPDDELIGGPS